MSYNDIWDGRMNLNDIIKSDKDRLFHVDDECYILFTGDSIEDEHPFIRIGNWADMPAELIPLIRNIVITDSVTGNPGYEQFNINPERLENNRYIGSADIMRRYIEVQKLFGLDLSGVELVDIKKDLPEFSREKNLSDDDQFIGVFYRDGSFKTIHRGNTVLELKDNKTQADSSAARNGPALAVLDGNPVFAGKSSVVSYMLPSGGMKQFIEAGLDSGADAVIYPSGSYMNLVSFLVHKKSGKLRIFTSGVNDIRAIKKLFPNMSIDTADISHIKHGSPNDLFVENYQSGQNIRAVFGTGLRVAFVKSVSGIQQVLKDKLDGIIIPYSVYKESVLLFKSTATPIAVINDTPGNISTRLAKNIPCLRENVLYKLIKAAPDELSAMYGGGDIHAAQLKDEIIQLKSRAENSGAGRKAFFNTMSLVRLMINSSVDRDAFSQIQKLYHEFAEEPAGLFEAEERRVFTLAFCLGNIYQFADAVPGKKPRPKQKDSIAEDRERLMRLLLLYLNEGALGKEKLSEELGALRGAIEKRRETYNLER
ncbi:MAG: hypothetical protein LBT84_02145, partial [Spirochaetia bacterium]|nr:hypothetical protein [Spirochaetia bacterium]